MRHLSSPAFRSLILKAVAFTVIFLACYLCHAGQREVIDDKQVVVINKIIWAADKVEVPRSLLLALCWGEGWGYRAAKHRNPTHMDGGSLSYGICQIKLSTARFMDTVYKHKVPATPARLERDDINAFYAAKYLKYQLVRYDGNWQLAVDAYNKHNAKGVNTPYVRKFKRNLTLVNKSIETE